MTDHHAADRHAAHVALPEVGEEGQRRLAAARVLIVGVGGLGCPAATYLASAGIGRLTLVDLDRVDASNLSRQVLFAEADCGCSKAEVARERLLANNSGVEIVAHTVALGPRNARDLVRAHDVVLDCSDNYLTRYVLNDACVLENRPLVYAAIHRFEGRITVFAHGDGPCYRCMYPEPPTAEECACSETGVIGVLPGLLGVMQAAEAMKLILGIGRTLAGRLLLVDSLSMRFDEIALTRNPGCGMCEKLKNAGWTAPKPDPIETQEPASIESITAAELQQAMADGTRFQFLDLRPPHEREGGALPEAIFCFPLEFARLASQLDRTAPVVIYCRAGMQSRFAAMALRQAGVPRVLHLAGGFNAWLRNSNDTISADKLATSSNGVTR